MVANLPTLKIEAAISAATGSYGAWDSSLWDTGTWGSDFNFVDITKYVRSFRTKIGRQRETDHFSAGTGTLILDNWDARFSPDNLSSPYVTSGVTGLRPWRTVRITATWSGTTYAVFYGYAKAWQEIYEQGGFYPTVTVPLVDGIAQLGAFNPPGLATPIGSGETTGRRIQRILDNSGSTTQPRNIDVGSVTCQPTSLSSNSMSEIYLTADSEGGAFWQDPDGTFAFERYGALIENTRSNTVQTTFGDGAGELPYENIVISYDGDLLWNQATFQRTNGVAQTITDATSQSLYGQRQQKVTGLVCESDATCNALAQLYVARYKDPDARVTEATFHPAANTALWPDMLGRRIRDLVTVKRRPPGNTGGLTISRNEFIDGVEHDFDAGTLDWHTTFRFSSAAAWQGFTSSRWDVGLWDTATWFY